MRVLLIHNFYQSNQIGGEDLVFLREKSALEQAIGPENVFTLSKRNDDLRLWQLPFIIWSNLAFARKVKAIIKKEQIDLVHVHNFFPLITPSVFVAAKQAGAKVVHTLHNYRWWCLSGTLFYQNQHCQACVKRRLMWLGVLRGCYRGSKAQSLLAAMAFAWYKRRRVLEAIDGWLVLTEHQRSIVSQWLPFQKIFLKPNSIDTQQLSTDQPKEGFIFVGRLEQGKGIDLLCEVWRKLQPSEKLTIIGEGPLLEACKQQTQGLNVTFLGSVPHVKTKAYLAKAKFCIVPSKYYETFSLVTLEAMMAGTPVIGLNIGTRPELIEHGVSGLLASPQELANLIASCDDYDYEQLSLNARKAAMAFEQTNMTTKQLAIYRELREA